MSRPGRPSRRTTAALAALGALTLVAALPATASSASSAAAGGHRPAKAHHAASAQMKIQLLSFNDFHGNLKPPGGSSGRLVTGYGTTLPPVATTVDAGGVANLASTLRDLRAGQAHSVTVAAGDLIGASPLLSAAFHDEPTIEAMNMLGLEASAVGNHEFDEGYRELQRMQAGGCLPDGDGADNQNSCPDGSFDGADFHYLSANVRYAGTDKTILPAYWVKNFGHAKIGFIGMTLKETPTIVSQAGVEGLEFTDEVATANALVPVLRKQGVKAIVVLIHQGGVPNKVTYTGATGTTYTVDAPYDYTCAKGGTLADDSAIIPIARNLDPQIDLVVSGHTHQPYVCDIPDPHGRSRLVTSASSFGRLVTETNLTYDLRKRDIVRSSVTGANMIVTRRAAPAADLTALVTKYDDLVGPIANKALGNITADVPRAQTAAGESPLGDLIADAQLNDPTVVIGGVTPVVAFMNPGGIRADLTYAQTPGDGYDEGDGVVTYEEAFTVQPFNNYDVSMDLTGADIYALLEQQWLGLNGGTAAKVLQVSKGFSYRWNPDAAPGSRVIVGSVAINGVPVAPGATYRVVANAFLAGGGDNFDAFKNATAKYIGGLDINAFAAYLASVSPYTPTEPSRITIGTS